MSEFEGVNVTPYRPDRGLSQTKFVTRPNANEEYKVRELVQLLELLPPTRQQLALIVSEIT